MIDLQIINLSRVYQRRAKRVDSSRQLDQFADLNLGASDEDEVAHPGTKDVPELSLASVAHYASMLEHDVSPTSSINHVIPKSPQSPKDEIRKPKKKRKNKSKPNKWADKCMYAELLEMAADDPWSKPSGNDQDDGLPTNLESGWVAVGPVPVGKRCLAVTHQSAGIAGAGVLYILSVTTNLRICDLGSPKHHVTIATLRKSSHTTVSLCATATHHS